MLLTAVPTVLPAFRLVSTKKYNILRRILAPHHRLFSTTFSERSRNVQYDRDNGIISLIEDGKYIPIYKSVIGIEIHAQLAVPTKLFSSGPTKFHPHYSPTSNTSTSSHDISYPGTLPMLSKSSVQKAVISAAALKCDIQEISRFERKHYTYADLPFGYQVTQQRWPLAKDGVLNCRRYSPPKPKKKKKKKKGSAGNGDGNKSDESSLSKFFSVGIDRIQMEQDTGKTTSSSIDDSKTRYLINFNRAGSTLIEIVFKPQINAAHEAASVVSTLQSLLKFLDTCDGKMEEGSLRCDLNVSIYPLSDKGKDFSNIEEEENNPFQQYLPEGVGNRVEVKNLNSIKQIIQSAEYEAIRQTQQILDGTPTGRETRTFDPKSGHTIKIRDKGGAVDYRFLPEPDLPPLHLDKNVLDHDSLQNFLKSNLPELPEDALERLISQYGISEASAIIITSDRPAIAFFEETVQLCISDLENSEGIDTSKIATMVANWLCNDLFALIKESATHQLHGEDIHHPISVEYSNVNSTRLAKLMTLIVQEIVSTTQAKKLLQVMFSDDLESLPGDIAEKNGWKLITNMDDLQQLCRDVILCEKNSKQFNQYKQGGKNIRKMSKFFKGNIMKESKGNAHPELLGKALDSVLHELAPDVEE